MLKLIHLIGSPNAKHHIKNSLIINELTDFFRRASLFKKFYEFYHKEIGFVNNQDDLVVS